MTAYILRRLLSTVPTIIGVALLVFVIFHSMSGDPAYRMAGKHATPQQIEEIRRQHGYDQPMPVQFARYLVGIATFNFGESKATRQPIRNMIISGIGPSLSIAIPAFTITTIFAVLIALLASYYRGRWIDKAVIIFCVLGMSFPMLGLILFGQNILAYRMGLFPISGYEAVWPDLAHYVALPVLIWITVSLGYDVRFFRTAILEETGQDYVRTARAKGLPEKRVFLKHVLKNSMVPIITNIVIGIPLLILGSFLLESFFSIPGLGSITIDALNNDDLPVLQAMTTIQALLMIFGGVLTDILYTVVDPRVKFQ